MARERVIALVDMDCFYVQVEQRLNPTLYGKPCAVVQYNKWKGGAIIAVGYEARKFGVTRNMRGDDAKEKCPDIILTRVPEARGKADLTRYRDAGAEVIEVLQTFSEVCERASVDEAYLDLTETMERSLDTITLENLAEETLKCCHVVGFTDQTSCDVKGMWMAALSNENNRCLAMGALVIQKAREAIKNKTGFSCSAGIAHNKMLAKLAGGTHKPNQQTLLPCQSVAVFFQTIPVRKVRYFGGKFGQSVMNLFQVENMSDLTKFTKEELKHHLGEKSGSWLYHVCRGIEHEVVRSRQLPKSTGCGKNFPGKMMLVSREKVRYWMSQLADELCDRLKGEQDKNHRTAKLISVGLKTANNTSGVRSFPLRISDQQSICDCAMQVIKSFNSGSGDTWYPGIVSLYMNASKFEEPSKAQGSSSIASFFAKKESDETLRCLDLEIEKDKTLTVDKESESISEKMMSSSDFTKIHQIEEADGEFEDISELDAFEPPLAPGTEPDDIEARSFNYDRDEIDQSIIRELPDDIRNEIENFLGLSKSSQASKRCNRGIEKYAISEMCTPGSRTTKSSRRTDSDNLKSSLPTHSQKIPELIQCSRCRQTFSSHEMPEHLDFHFAMKIQENDRMNDSLKKDEPPKKRQKSTIDSFFVSKER